MPQIRRAVVEWARDHRVPDPVLSRVALAVTEAAANVVVHAYRDGAPPREPAVELELELDRDGFRVSVADRGLGMVPRADSPGLGFGMPLIASVADRLEVVHREAGGTEVCMRWADGALATA